MRIDNTTNLFNQQNNSPLEQKNLSNLLSDKENNPLLQNTTDPFSLGFDELSNNDISNEHILYTTEDQLSSTEQFTKNIIDNIMQQFFGEDQEIPLFPQGIPDDVAEMFQNPYDAINKSDLSSGMMVGVHQEYYQKQTLDFNTSLTIQTPNQTYEMEISISITQELYISQDTVFGFGDEQSFDPISFFHDKDENPFEGLDSLNFIFDKAQEEEETLADKIKEMLELFDSYDEEKENSNSFINVYSQTYESKYQLSSIIDSDQGKAVFLSSSETYYNEERLSYQSSNTKDENLLDLSV